MSFPTKAIFFAGCLLITIPSLLPAQPKDVSFRRYTAEDGLESSHISCLLQDHQGFLWIGTANGLYRFDGYSFKAFRRDPSDTTSLSDNFIRALYEDSSPGGRLWVGTSNGLNAFDPRTEKFTHHLNRQKRPDISTLNFIRTLWSNEHGVIWVGTHKGGLARISQDKKYPSPVRVAQPDRLTFNTINSIVEDADGMLWLGTSGAGLIAYDPQTGHYEIFKSAPSVSAAGSISFTTRDASYASQPKPCIEGRRKQPYQDGVFRNAQETEF